MDYPFTDNYAMNITAIISANLDAWMAGHAQLNTLKKVAAKAGVGFGTVRRARNGDGNTTIQNLAAIAKAFGRNVCDLITPIDYSAEPAVTTLAAQERPPEAPLMEELVTIAERINDRGQAELIGRAKELALAHPRAKANRRSS